MKSSTSLVPFSMSLVSSAHILVYLYAFMSFAISLYKEYQGQGIGSQLMVKMLELLKWQGYRKASLAVEKANYAVKMYTDLGFKTVSENAEEYIMVCEL